MTFRSGTNYASLSIQCNDVEPSTCSIWAQLVVQMCSGCHDAKKLSIAEFAFILSCPRLLPSLSYDLALVSMSMHEQANTLGLHEFCHFRPIGY